jgi:hypothetical protein
MAKQTNPRRRISTARRQPRAVRTLVVSLGVIAAAAVLAAPAYADPGGDAFLSALSSSGVNYGDPGSAVAMGQSICPMLVQPGGSFASTASSITGHNGMSPAIAGLFTSIAISMYCPSMMASIASGNIPSVPGMPGMADLAGIPGIPGM